MAKYVDTGLDPTGGGKKKKSRKGFKSDRHENYLRMVAKKNGKNVKESTTARISRPKSIVFDDSSRQNYLLTLHKKKNERRVQAFVDVKRKMRKDNAKTRREQREEARRAYNAYARVPILPNYTYRLPTQAEEGFVDEEEEDVTWEEETQSNPNDNEDDERMPWMSVDDPQMAAHDAEMKLREAEEENQMKKHRRLSKRLATVARSTHTMPSVMVGGAEEEDKPKCSSSTRKSSGVWPTELPDAAPEDEVTVEVLPLFARGGGTGAAAAAAPLPSNDFTDLPLSVQQELRRLRQETKGPAKTKPRLHMMKELEKIRKIKKHSRKGHGKRKASGKRKNRK